MAEAATEAPPKRIGAPSKYTRELADWICELLADGKSMRVACAEADIDTTTVSKWVRDDVDGFALRYARARSLYINALESEIAAQCDEMIRAARFGGEGVNAIVTAYKIKIDAIKWELSKLRPAVYGDRVAQEISGPAGGPIQVAAVDLTRLTTDQLRALREMAEQARLPEASE